MMISVLIANWNTREYLHRCLLSIYQTQPDTIPLDIEIIVVDNASADGSVEMIRQDFPRVKLVESQENLGFGRGTNLAARFAQGEFLLLLNPDTVLHPGTLEGIVTYLLNNPRTGAVGPRIDNPDGTLQISCSPQPTLQRETWRLFHLDSIHAYSQYSRHDLEAHLQSGKVFPVDVLLGACILLRRQALQSTDFSPSRIDFYPSRIDFYPPFDEQFFVYSEEVDLCLRIRKAGWGIAWLPTCRITHHGGQSTRQNADAMFLELYRNKVKFFRKHYGAGITGLYKAILYSAALPRWWIGGLLANSSMGRLHSWGDISRQYRKLIYSIPSF